jgi:hypothetical protein
MPSLTAPPLRVDISRKWFYKEFKKVVGLADIVIKVLDARDPLGCRCLDIERYIRSVNVNKKIVLVLNKVGVQRIDQPNTPFTNGYGRLSACSTRAAWQQATELPFNVSQRSSEQSPRFCRCVPYLVVLAGLISMEQSP